MANDDLFIMFGFLLPPNGEVVDLANTEELPRHYEYCKDYIENKAPKEIKRAFDIFFAERYPDLSPIEKEGAYTDFCVMVLGWCKVGNHLDMQKKIITCNACVDWQFDICEEYESYGFTVDYVPRITMQVENSNDNS